MQRFFSLYSSTLFTWVQGKVDFIFYQILYLYIPSAAALLILMVGNVGAGGHETGSPSSWKNFISVLRFNLKFSAVGHENSLPLYNKLIKESCAATPADHSVSQSPV